MKRATHRVSLFSSSWRPSALLLTGVSLEPQAPQTGVAAQVTSTINRMKAALKESNNAEFFGYPTPIGGDRLKQWFATAPDVERAAYRKAFIDQQPFFVFASPLIVVYVKTPENRIEALYFIITADKRLLWTNASCLTASDKVFKQAPLLAAAESKPPFSRVASK